MTLCPLCTHQANFFIQDKKRAYYLCPHCGLVFAAPNSHVLPNIERQRYARAQEISKQKSLSQFIFPLLEHIAQQQPNQTLSGLNFGRVLDSNSLEQITQAGHILNQYDPFFAANQEVLNQQYDFVCCYRVFEHFRSPQKEWRLLSQLVRPNGWLAISTPLLNNLQQFEKWHYKTNPTHVSFYQQLTFEYMATNASFTLLFASKDFILMQKTSGSDIKRNLI
ncbi:class I SAM-dependent methyltransferase [Shewanella intestini]|uniref:Class I SAM-dependent methyltransferase n=1 Tax=Shewanella intestini TaxID=2017544 RepID=A0ABS5I3K3_9GAMM|nr:MULTISPECIES: class I SAM-dependent methyltransferase [Shewanella]MBR9728617.1 class I SAM-dependent methyltransferase [Shewanella intestini]MRG37327.1 methyltransferase domain-containing protein [Shewanella sp. XMDDZSB0408]